MMGVPGILAATMVPAWIVLPLAGVTMLAIAVHVLRVQVSEMHRMRKRLRIVNGLIMMFVAAAIAYALGGVQLVTDPKQHPDQARMFVLVWVVIVALLAVVIVLAVVDALGTAGWGVRTHYAMRKEFREKVLAHAAGKSEGTREGNGADSSGETRRG